LKKKGHCFVDVSQFSIISKTTFLANAFAYNPKLHRCIGLSRKTLLDFGVEGLKVKVT
jgi:hypothetical protein